MCFKAHLKYFETKRFLWDKFYCYRFCNRSITVHLKYIRLHNIHMMMIIWNHKLVRVKNDNRFKNQFERWIAWIWNRIYNALNFIIYKIIPVALMFEAQIWFQTKLFKSAFQKRCRHSFRSKFIQSRFDSSWVIFTQKKYKR